MNTEMMLAPEIEPGLALIAREAVSARGNRATPATARATVARMQHYFERRCDQNPSALALVCGTDQLTYAELDRRANRLAQYLKLEGIGAGDKVGILLERSTFSYVALLGILKSGAAFVPIDASYPADRVAFIAGDAELAGLITSAELAARNAELPCPAIAIDTLDTQLACMPSTRPVLDTTKDSLAYLIYTSGTTGRPKGVAVNHSNICFFLKVCTPIYQVSATDRVYQGMTLAFDFSIEEVWPTWIAGAALVAGPTDGRRIGSGLADFLNEQRITMMYCVPTLLATLDRDVPSLHTLIVGGEACPRDLVERWSQNGRRMLNTYGPTETTVTATWTELLPGKAVTIGNPLPGYTAYILDENANPVPYGESGELCIGGPGVAQGYVNRPDLTAAKFIDDRFDKGGRLYRSGDLARFAPNGEIEFLGRIDSQVKIRGFRIELAEIEAVLLEDAAVENAIVSTVGVPAADLVAYVTLHDGTARAEEAIESLRERLGASLRHRLPVYMVPAYLEVLERIPMLASGKADRKALPPPARPRLSLRAGEYVAPATEMERKLATVWAAIFGRDEISVEADFFLDLGGHSLFAAQAISRLRQDAALRGLSVADLYANPTIRLLARHLEQTAARPATATRRKQAPLRHSDARVWRAGLVQFALLYALILAMGAPVALLFSEHGHAPLAFTGWDFLLPSLVMVMSVILPVVLKWTLIGRLQPGTIPLWGWQYVRIWLVRKSLDFSPMQLLAGSPLAPLYARLMGARIGRNVHLGTAQLHLADLVEIGHGASIGYEAEIQPFVVEDGRMILKPIRIGAGAFVGTKAVILAGARIGTGARVAEQTLVGRDQVIPEGQTWAGSPARRTDPDPELKQMDAQPPASARISRGLWTGYIAGLAFLEMLPLLVALPGLLVVAEAYRWGGLAAAFASTPIAGLLFVITTCTLVWAGKRAALPGLQPGIYPVNSAFGLRKWFADKLMTASLTFTNTLYATLYAVPFLRSLGARIGSWSEVSTVSHVDPDLLVLGNGTFVADLASIGSATFHNGYVVVGGTTIGDRTFIGNASVVRSRAELKDNSLIGVASVAPREAPAAGTSWLGSPAIFLPKRQVIESFDESVTFRPKAWLVAYRLFVEFLRIVLPPSLLYCLGAAVSLVAVRELMPHGTFALLTLMPAAYFVAAISVTLTVAAIKWALIGAYRPRIEPLWAPFVRHSELITGLYESAVVPVLAGMTTGTPFAALVLRLFGVKVGRRVWLDTTFMTEFDLVRVGDDASVGRATSLQSHLFEDRVMKMSTVNVGAGAAVGTRAVVLYDSTVGEGTHLDSLSLAMKGESLPSGTDWRGIPARLQ